MLDLSKLCSKRRDTENTIPTTDIKSEIYFILSDISITTYNLCLIYLNFVNIKVY